MKILLLTLAIYSIFLISCGTKTLSCKETFDKYFEVNMTACVKPLILRGVDSTQARKFCSCKLHKLYEVDSTFVLKSGKEMEEFTLKVYSLTPSCDTLLQSFRTPRQINN